MAYGIAAECYPWWDQLFQKQIVEQFDFKVPFSYKIFEGSIILHFLYHCHLKATKILLLWANTPLVEYIIQKKNYPFQHQCQFCMEVLHPFHSALSAHNSSHVDTCLIWWLLHASLHSKSYRLCAQQCHFISSGGGQVDRPFKCKLCGHTNIRFYPHWCGKPQWCVMGNHFIHNGG